MGIEHPAEVSGGAGLATRRPVPGIGRVGETDRIKNVDVAVDFGLLEDVHRQRWVAIGLKGYQSVVEYRQGSPLAVIVYISLSAIF
jgi:hypothetical protein